MDRMLKFFAYDHLRDDLKPVSQAFAHLAHHLAQSVPAGPERTVSLRKLLEAKDAAVRAVAVPDADGRISELEARLGAATSAPVEVPPPRPEPSSPIRKG